MTTILEIPLRNLSPSAIEDLQAQYPDATLRIETESAISAHMDEAQFWSIIAAFDWRTRSAESIMAPAVKLLSKLDEAEIYKFHDILHEKLFAVFAPTSLEIKNWTRQLPPSPRYLGGNLQQCRRVARCNCCTFCNNCCKAGE